jgi:hypothetical protein
VILPLQKSHLEKILKPISRLTDSCILRIENNKLFSLCASSDQTVVLYANLDLKDLKIDSNFKLNIISISKLLTGLDCLGDEGEFFLELKTNHIVCGIKEHDGTKTHFKYHLVDDRIVNEAPVNLNKISSIKFDTSFTLSQSNIKRVLSAYAFTSNANTKLYLRSENNKVYGLIDDKTQCNLDNVDLCLSDTYEGVALSDEIILSMEIFKMISMSKEDIKIKINNQYKVLIFTNNENQNVMLKYIISALVK